MPQNKKTKHVSSKKLLKQLDKLAAMDSDDNFEAEFPLNPMDADSPQAHSVSASTDDDDDSEGEEDDEDDEEDDEEEQEQENEEEETLVADPVVPSVTPQKRRRGGNKKDTTPAPASKTVLYVLAVFSAIELQKPVSKRSAKSATLSSSTEEPWDTIKAQLLAKISSLLDPKTLSFDNYKVTATIPRVLGKPGVPLASDTDYALIVQRFLGMRNTDPLANITIEELTSTEAEDKENNDTSAKKKSKNAKRDPALLPGNVAKATRITEIRTKWKCPKKTAQCLGGTFYVGPDFDGHFPMGHDHVDCWASWSLANDPDGSLDAPPNHHLFPRIGGNTSAMPLSPVLQRRLEAQNRSQAAAAPTINLQIGSDFLGLVQGSSTRPAAPAAQAHVPAPVLAHTDSLDNKFARLLPQNYGPGADMPIHDFCDQFGLDNEILTKWAENGFRNAKHLRHLTQGNLADMKFLLGEIAAVRDAMEQWGVRHTD
ncbi:hypothetical protein HGRIS_009346 [Hohenbuehelia grisea]|uniref:Uncharacterized protein n=1 Tax=Hohenbuehelia grisea TaxID=104357 RepID=A0ABR3J175_9AGAR